MAACLGKMLNHFGRSKHFEEDRRKKKAKRDNVKANLEKATRFSAGALVSTGVYNLDNPDMLAAFDMRQRQKSAEAAAKVSRKRDILKKNANGVAALRRNFRTPLWRLYHGASRCVARQHQHLAQVFRAC